MDGRDELFGLMAVEYGYITHQQLQDCMTNRKSTEGIEQILLTRGFISPAGVLKIRDRVKEHICSQTEVTGITFDATQEMGADEDPTTMEMVSPSNTAPRPKPKKQMHNIPEQIGRYQVLEEIGRGGMGAVYQAFDPMLKRYVAIKMLLNAASENPTAVQRFLTEAQAVAALNHPNIVAIYDIGKLDEGDYYLVMEYVEGMSLRELMAQESPMPTVKTIEIISSIADALQIAHNNDIIHRDIKPANILMAKNGDAKVTDFGLAKIVSGASLSASGEFLGTPYYISPEQVEDQKLDARCDIYSLGITFYQMLSNRLPFEAESIYGILTARLKREPVPLTSYDLDIPLALSQIVHRMIAKEPDRRFSSATLVSKTLRDYLQGKQIDLGESKPKKKSKKGLCFALLIMIIVGLYFAFPQQYQKIRQLYLSKIVKKAKKLMAVKPSVEKTGKQPEKQAQKNETGKPTDEKKEPEDGKKTPDNGHNPDMVKVEPRPLQIEVDTVFSGAIKPEKIWIDGKSMGKSLAPGEYTLEIEHSGYRSIKQKITIPKGKGNYILRLSLQAKPRIIRWNFTPRISKPILISYRDMSGDWQKWDEQMKEISPGTYVFKIETVGYKEISRTIEIKPGVEPITLDIELEKEKQPEIKPEQVDLLLSVKYDAMPGKDSGHLQFQVFQNDSPLELAPIQLFFDKNIAQYKFFEINTGDYRLVLNHPGYQEFSKNVSVKSKDNPIVECKLSALPRKLLHKVESLQTGKFAAISHIVHEGKKYTIREFTVKPGIATRVKIILGGHQPLDIELLLPAGTTPYPVKANLHSIMQRMFRINNSLPGIPLEFICDGETVPAKNIQIRGQKKQITGKITLPGESKQLIIRQLFFHAQIQPSKLQTKRVDLEFSQDLLRKFLNTEKTEKTLPVLEKLAQLPEEVKSQATKIAVSYLENLSLSGEPEQLRKKLLGFYAGVKVPLSSEIWEKVKDKYKAETIVALKNTGLFSFDKVNSQGYLEYKHQKTNIIFVLLPGGVFQMGSTVDISEGPVHQVTLSPFLIAKYEISYKIWKNYIRANTMPRLRANFPAFFLSWDDAMSFCQKTGLELPREAEWEYACRAGSKHDFFWGDEYSYKYMLCQEDPLFRRKRPRPLPVGRKLPNNFGLHDMSGNIAEWCFDVYQNYQAKPQVNPKGSEGRGFMISRVARGGSFRNFASSCRSAARKGYRSNYRGDIGIRPVYRLENK